MLSKIIGGPSLEYPITKVVNINKDILATLHDANGGFKLWNVETGEELHEFLFGK